MPDGAVDQGVSQQAGEAAAVIPTVLPTNGPSARSSGGIPIGSWARDLYRRLCRRPRSVFDPASDFGVAFIVPAYHVLRFAYFTWRDNGAVRRQRGISLWRQLAAQWRLMTVYGTDPSAYYSSALYDRPGGVDEIVNYLGRDEVKNGLFRQLHWLRPKIYGRRVSLGDKLAYTKHCQQAGLPVPPVLYLADRGRWSLVADQPAPISPELFDHDIFVKPRQARGARGATWFDRVGPGLYRGKDGSTVTRAELLRKILRRSRYEHIMVLPKMVNHPEIADLASQSLLAFRVFTCLDADDNPVVTHAMLRILSKLEPSWKGASEYAVRVDLQTGVLGQLCDDDHFAPDCWWDRHPITGSQIAGRRIENWQAITDLAKRAHRSFLDRMIVGWDIALTPDGPMLIEGNSYPDTHFLQRVHRQLVGESPLGPLLRHHLQRLADHGPKDPHR